MDKQIIILAAGKGSRMNSDLPKVMHKVAGTSMIEHVLHNCNSVTDDLVLVYSSHLEPYLSNFKAEFRSTKQEEQLGTAHAVSVAKDFFDDTKYIGVIYGDNPLITPDIIENLFNHLENTKSQAVTLAFEHAEDNQYGRIILDKDGNFQRIVESKFATEDEKKITLCNSGIMAFAPGVLSKYIDKCLVTSLKTAEREFYLTDIIEICASHGEKVTYFKSRNHNLLVGVNTQDELASINSTIKKK